jgi:hypothetical protein
MVKFWAGLIFLCNVATAHAQIVRGVIVESGASAPVRGAFVVLVDSAGRARGGVLSDEKGFYAIATSQGGTYRLRAERIGHASALSDPFVLTAGQPQTVNMRVGIAPIELAAVTSAKMTDCVRRPKTGERTAQLWEEARKALSVAQWASNQPYRFQMRTWVRDLEVPSMKVISETARVQVTRARPYAAIAIDTLLEHGFVRKDSDGMIFYGIDAEVLLSDEFQDLHCFHSVEGEGANAGDLGLVFEPAKRHKLPGVSGTLWLDRKTFQLKHLEFTYVNVPREYRFKGTGGRTEFARLENGAFVVSRWYIRMPTVVGRGVNAGRLYGMQEEGGEVTNILNSGN